MRKGPTDPRSKQSEFAGLFADIKRCKKHKTCKALASRAYYFEPNPETAEEWVSEGLYTGELDRRLMFVCESPGRQFQRKPAECAQCWNKTAQDKRFLAFRREHGFESCYITNSVKCGVRRGSKHTDEEAGACSQFLVREIDLINPQVVVAMGWLACRTLVKFVMHKLKCRPVLYVLTHYSARGNVQEKWEREVVDLKALLGRLATPRDAVRRVSGDSS